MENKGTKEKTPEVKLKKEMEIAVHKKKKITPKNDNRASFHIKNSSVFFEKKKAYEEPYGKDQLENILKEKNVRDKKIVPTSRYISLEKEEQNTSIRSTEERNWNNRKRSETINGKNVPDRMKKGVKYTASRNIGKHGNNRQGREQSLPQSQKGMGNTSGKIPQLDVYPVEKLQNDQGKAEFKREKKIRELSNIPQIHAKRTEVIKVVDHSNEEKPGINGQRGEQFLPQKDVGNISGGVTAQDLYPAGILTNDQAKVQFRQNKKINTLLDIPQIQTKKKEKMIRGGRQGGKEVFTQLEEGADVNEIFPAMGNVRRSLDSAVEKWEYAKAEEKLKIKQADQKISNKQFQKKLKNKKKEIIHKQTQQAVRQRKIQYVINKMNGSGEQDSIVQVVKDIVRVKVEFVILKVVKFMSAFLAPLFGIFFIAAFPVVLIVILLYCSPLGAFMENPSKETPSIQEILGGYYMEFNQSVSANAGENGAVTYLHERDGYYVSNYMDTLMVYMVHYGTGDLGVVMDEEHKKYLKEIFDAMNNFEDTTVTSTIQAGQSLGNVVTSGYCSCSICCGQWSGGPTASGAMPTANHTLAVDADNPFVPLGTRIIMNGTEYVVEDTGNFDQYGVQFDIYFDDHTVASNWGHQTMEAFLANGDENTISVTRRGSYVKNLNYEDYIALGKLTEEQEELLREAMSEEFRSEIPSFGVGSDVANLALTKVGCQYSQDRRYEEGFYDCSSLVQRCYAEFGIDLPAVASTQGQYIVEHGLEVTEDMLEPGDLIFYSYEQNGEFRNISHVGIYIGNGRMVHAANSARGVVNDPFNPSNIGLYGRPRLGK